jgi:hypothetical protein
MGSVKYETIVKSFKKCGISNGLDGTKDDVLFEKVKVLTITTVMMCGSDEDFKGFCGQ